jgi:hypothetical protein
MNISESEILHNFCFKLKNYTFTNNYAGMKIITKNFN